MTIYPELEFRFGGAHIDLNLNRAVHVTGRGGPLAHTAFILEHGAASLGSPTPNAPVTIIDADLGDVDQALAEIPTGKPAILFLYPEGREYDARAFVASLPAHIKLLVIADSGADNSEFDASVHIGRSRTHAGLIPGPRRVYPYVRSTRGLVYSQAALDAAGGAAAEQDAWCS